MVYNCACCGVTFVSNRFRKDGEKTFCTEKCSHRFWSKEWREKNPERSKEINRRSSLKNREKRNNYQNSQYKENPEGRINRMQEWRRKNPEKYKASFKRDRERLAEWIKENYSNWKQEVIKHYTKGKNCCECCGFSDQRFLTIDHIVPRSKTKEPRMGGSSLYKYILNRNFPSGYQILCYNCNMGKRDNLDCPHKLQS